MPDWVEEFDNFTPSAVVNPSSRSKMSQMEELEQEMKLLHWHKLANEAALKAALIRTRKLRKAEGEEARREALQERAEWMQQIIEDEQAKPLEVDNEFIKEYERREALEEERLDAEVQRHISCLKNLRQNLKKREETRNRNLKYKIDKAALAQTANNNSANYSAEPETQPKQQISGTLSKVIHSLDKLVELEKRISNLEHDTQSVGFAKKRTHGNVGEPTKTYYAVHVKSNRDKLPRIGGAKGSGKVQGGSGARMGALPQVKQSRRINRPSAGEQRSYQGKSNAQGSQRQDAVIKDWSSKKKRGIRSKTKPGQRTAVGAASGRKTNNRSLEQFNDIRRDFAKKKDQLAKGDGPKKAWGSKKNGNGR